jgi:ABC-type Fe3+/spermidine/putrescine transport system ATPase subunit
MVGGHEQPDSGDILIDDRSIVGLSANQIPTATVFQNYALFPHYTVFQNVAFGLRVRGLKDKEMRQRVGVVLELVGMQGFEHRDVITLSGGEKQRIATARALAVQPEILLMDEPLGALDRLIRLRMQRELSDLLRRVDITTLYVTHDQHEALTMADRVAVIKRGRIRQLGTPVEIYRRPQDRFVADFIGGTNFVRGQVTRVEGTRVELSVNSQTICGRRRADQAIPVGMTTDAVLRPEDVTLNREPLSQNSWRCQVVQAVYVGDLTEYTVEVEGLDQLLQIKSLGAPAFQPGEEVRASWAEASLLILPRAPEGSD